MTQPWRGLVLVIFGVSASVGIIASALGVLLLFGLAVRKWGGDEPSSVWATIDVFVLLVAVLFALAGIVEVVAWLAGFPLSAVTLPIPGAAIFLLMACQSFSPPAPDFKPS